MDQVADSSGTLQTSMAEPGGFQIGYDLLTPDKKATGSPPSARKKTMISDRDIIVVLAKSSSTGDIDWTQIVEEDW